MELFSALRTRLARFIAPRTIEKGAADVAERYEVLVYRPNAGAEGKVTIWMADAPKKSAELGDDKVQASMHRIFVGYLQQYQVGYARRLLRSFAGLYKLKIVDPSKN